jgi:excisionase family DNA binding protein
MIYFDRIGETGIAWNRNGEKMPIQSDSRTRRKLLTTDEFADALGLSPKTVRQWTWMRKVPFVRVGRAIRFQPETVDEILNRGTVPALEGR